jgi:hypothetical protein
MFVCIKKRIRVVEGTALVTSGFQDVTTLEKNIIIDVFEKMKKIL